MYNMTVSIYKKIKKITIEVLKFFNPFDIFQSRAKDHKSSQDINNNINYDIPYDYRLLTDKDIPLV